jgi:hypothetical protein
LSNLQLRVISADRSRRCRPRDHLAGRRAVQILACRADRACDPLRVVRRCRAGFGGPPAGNCRFADARYRPVVLMAMPARDRLIGWRRRCLSLVVFAFAQGRRRLGRGTAKLGCGRLAYAGLSGLSLAYGCAGPTIPTA